MRIASFLLLACLSAAAALPAGNSDWAEPLLKEVKLTPAEAQIEPNRWTGGGPHRLDTFSKLWDDWRKIDPVAVKAGKDFLASADSFSKLIETASPFLDVKPAPKVQPRFDPNVNLPQFVAELHAALGMPLTEAQTKDLAERAKVVPEGVAVAAAELLRAMPGALKRRSEALANLGGPEKWPAAFDRARGLAQNYTVDAESLKLLADIDLAALVHGGLELAGAMDRAAETLAFAKLPEAEFSFTWETPLGTIRLNGTQANEYGEGPFLVIIDTGGKDKYASAAATQSATNPISLVIDWSGNDTYETKKSPAVAAGVLGYGFLLDAAGDDTYRVEQFGCGAAGFGVGILIDRAGRDTYELDRVGQGSATAGIGILADLSGNDTYRCFQQAQGYAAVKGFGALVDREGDDRFEADNTTIRYPSPQDPKHNASLAQGCGFGFRDHPGAGNSLAGGIGLLVDGKGNDLYRCGVFGQGISYWYALGMLVDLEGADEYEGSWYCQASSAHYGVGVLCDLGGNDKYLAKLTMGQGAGHDFSTAWFRDAAGNDLYDCPGAGIGFALYNGIGIFQDQTGDDTYKTGAAAFGATGETRPESLCLAIFLDHGGTNVFPKDGRAKPKSTWVQPVNKDQPRSRGIGSSR